MLPVPIDPRRGFTPFNLPGIMRLPDHGFPLPAAAGRWWFRRDRATDADVGVQTADHGQ
jgi:hypothetical protein